MGSKIRVGLALGGGGVRALAHIGLLKVFEKEGISFDIIAGTSMGAIIGAHYALHRDAAGLEEAATRFLERKEIRELESLARTSEPEEKKLMLEKLALFVKELYLWNLSAIKRHVVEPAHIEALIKALVGDKKFEDAQIPFACVATDLLSGEEKILNSGPLLPAVMASSALPGTFPPVELEGRLLIDGGIVSTVPVDAARKTGAEIVIAADVESGVPSKTFEHGMDIMFQADYIRSAELTRVKLQSADVVIKPDVKDISWANFSKAGDCIRRGEAAAQGAVNEVRKIIAEKKRRLFFKRFFPFRLFS